MRAGKVGADILKDVKCLTFDFVGVVLCLVCGDAVCQVVSCKKIIAPLECSRTMPGFNSLTFLKRVNRFTSKPFCRQIE